MWWLSCGKILILKLNIVERFVVYVISEYNYSYQVSVNHVKMSARQSHKMFYIIILLVHNLITHFTVNNCHMICKRFKQRS